MRCLGALIAVVACTPSLLVPEQPSIDCTGANDCPAERVCILDIGKCLPRGAPCTEDNRAVANGNRCDAAGALGVCIDAACHVSRCGDGIRDPESGEACDAGAANSDLAADACRTSCVLPSCGDDVVDVARGEVCDAGADNSDVLADACRLDCSSARCGDGAVDSGEACDDAADNSDVVADACRSSCQAARCGDGTVDSGEDCDDGGTFESDNCTNACALPTCGDGIVWNLGFGVERCDDGNTITEACAYGETSCGVCASDCDLTVGAVRYCGDGVVDLSEGEACDDGNGAASDGCSAACALETDWYCDGQPSACTRIYYVSADAVGAGTGLSWVDAFASLRDALDSAALATFAVEVWVAAGTYYPDEGFFAFNDERDSSFLLADGVRVYGGFAVGAIARQERDPTANLTVLSGDLKQDDPLTNDNAYHVVEMHDVGATTRLEGVTVEGGRASGLSGSGSRGGGLFATDALAQFVDVTFADNFAGFGGGVYVENGHPVFSNCRFVDNEVDVVLIGSHGGGLSLRDAGATLDGCLFSGNVAHNEGGGMWAAGSQLDDVTITDTVFTGNSTRVAGGGALHLEDDSRALVRRTTFVDNQAGTTVAASGGAVQLFGNTGSNQETRFEECIFERNDASTGGAIFVDGTGHLAVVRTRFVGNEADLSGAALMADSPANAPTLVDITNSSFLANRALGDANTGGAIAIGGVVRLTVANGVFVGNRLGPLSAGVGGSVLYAASPSASSFAEVWLTSCTLVANEVTGTGGAAVYQGGIAVVSVQNTILMASLPAPVLAAGGGGSLDVSSTCHSEAAPLPGAGNRDSCNAAFVRDPLAGTGGWGAVDDDYGDLRLGLGSTAVDAGDASLLPLDVTNLDGDLVFIEALPLDAAGLGRVVDDPLSADTGAGAPPQLDIGAYERQP